ncbi:dihydroxyacetone kinase subunit DhaK [Streptomyces mirabilis]|uniref:dihydroxyacetone kinase subunit DhaK n=1 Tax=Streptomyces mirabilis TaxID=68239 RepID=UPI00332AB3C2
MAGALDRGEGAELLLAEQAGEGFVGQGARCGTLSHDVSNIRCRPGISCVPSARSRGLREEGRRLRRRAGCGPRRDPRIGEKVNDVTRSMGMALTACTPPAKGSPLLDPPEDAVEMGVGIYGEPGRKREKLQSAKAMVGELVRAVVDDLSNSERSAEAHQEQADL